MKNKDYYSQVVLQNFLVPPSTYQYVSSFGSVGAGNNKWAGGVLAPNGKIYCIPASSSQVLEIDPIKRTAFTFGFLSPTGYSGGVLAPNGKIYGIPAGAANILEIDTIRRTTSTFPVVGSYSGGGCLAPNGKIYAAPYTISSNVPILVIDPIARTTSTFGSLGLTQSCSGAVLSPNGRIYLIPTLGATSITEINPTNNSIISFGLGGSYSYRGGVLAPNGKIYCVPWSSSSVLEISGGSTYEPADWTLGAYHNKL